MNNSNKDYSVLVGMQKHASNQLRVAFNKGFKQGYNARREQESASAKLVIDSDHTSMENLQKAFLRLFCSDSKDYISVDAMRDIFGMISPIEIMKSFSAAEIINKIAEYDAKNNKISGDEWVDELCQSMKDTNFGPIGLDEAMKDESIGQFLKKGAKSLVKDHPDVVQSIADK